MIAIAYRSLQFLIFHVLISIVDHVSRLPRSEVSMRTRAAQVFAYLLTRGDKAFQNYYLSASRTTIERWATKLWRGPWP